MQSGTMQFDVRQVEGHEHGVRLETKGRSGVWSEMAGVLLQVYCCNLLGFAP